MICSITLMDCCGAKWKSFSKNGNWLGSSQDNIETVMCVEPLGMLRSMKCWMICMTNDYYYYYCNSNWYTNGLGQLHLLFCNCLYQWICSTLIIIMKSWMNCMTYYYYYYCNINWYTNGLGPFHTLVCINIFMDYVGREKL